MDDSIESVTQGPEKDPPSFEQVLDELGAPGRYQIKQLSLVLSSLTICAYAVMTIAFYGFTPFHECNKVNETHLLFTYGLQNDSTAHVSYHSCDIKVSTNQSDQIQEVGVLPCPSGRDFFDAKDTTYLSEWDLVCESKGRAEFSHVMFAIGQVVGGVVSSFMTDRFGRKPVLTASILLIVLSESAILFSSSIYVVYVTKIPSGVFYQSSVNSTFVICLELVAPRFRQAVGAALNFFWVIHVLILGMFAYFLQDQNWRYLQATGIICGFINFVFLFFYLKESPRWLAANDRKKEALAILKKASEENGKDFEIVKEKFDAFMAHTFPNSGRKPLMSEEKIHAETNEQNEISLTQNTSSLVTMLCNKKTIFLMFVAWFMMLTNDLTYYGLFISSSTLAGNRFLNFILMDLVAVPSMVLLLFVLNRFGRRKVFCIFIAVTAVALLISTLMLSVGKELAGSEVVNTVVFIVGKFSINISFVIVVIVIPEMFPTNVRSTTLGICHALSKIGSGFSPFFRTFHHEVQYGPGIVFTSMCLVSAILIWFLPETNDRDLPNTTKDMMEQRDVRKDRKV